MILVESPLDVARLRTADVTGGVSSFGVRVSDDQLDLIHAFANRLIIALDNGSAGREMTGEIRRSFHVVPTWLLDYSGTGARDIGEMTNAEIHAVSRPYGMK